MLGGAGGHRELEGEMLLGWMCCVTNFSTGPDRRGSWSYQDLAEEGGTAPYMIVQYQKGLVSNRFSI